MSAETLRILITTDNHLGYLERDPIRKHDSFNTLEECLCIAQENACDFVLLGGDLFHEHKPSLATMTRTLSLLRKYVMGSKSINFDIVSDPKINFPTHPNPCANFEDPNLNVEMPIFIIHGNHDDAVCGYSPIDILSTAGLVNYFGHSQDLDDIELNPILIRKGTQTNLAIYGLGYVRDERLHRCFTLGKITLRLPEEENPSNQSATSWFRILVIHQNRGIRNPRGKAGIYDEMLAGIADLVIWGNEHEQKAHPHEIDPTQSESGRGFDIIQPGSTVVTSLGAEGPTRKMCCVVEIRKTSYRLFSHPLRSVRPLVLRTIDLSQEQIPKRRELVEEYLRNSVENMAQEAEELTQEIPGNFLEQNPQLRFPLLRLNVDYNHPDGTPYPTVHPARFGQRFVDIAANPQEILHGLKIRSTNLCLTDPDQIFGFHNIATTDAKVRIQDLLHSTTKDVCTMLCESVLGNAVLNYAEKEEKGAIDDAIDKLLQNCQKTIWKTVREDVGPGHPVDLEQSRIIQEAREYKTHINKEQVRDHAVPEVNTEQLLFNALGSNTTVPTSTAEVNVESNSVEKLYRLHCIVLILQIPTQFVEQGDEEGGAPLREVEGLLL